MLVNLDEPLCDTPSGYLPHRVLHELQLIWGSKLRIRSLTCSVILQLVHGLAEFYKIHIHNLFSPMEVQVRLTDLFSES